MRSIDPFFRVRAARLLGREPFVRDNLAALRTIGWPAMPPVKVVQVEVVESGACDKVGGGRYHMVEADDGVRGWALVEALLDIVEADFDARIGCDAPEVVSLCVPLPVYQYHHGSREEVLAHPRVLMMVSLLEGAGVVVSPVADVELDRKVVPMSVVCFPAAEMPLAHNGGKERLRVLALIGDAFLRELIAKCVYAVGQTAGEYAGQLRVAENQALSEFVRISPGLVGLFGQLGQGARATHFEAMLGAVVLYWGDTDALKFLAHVKFPVEIPKPVVFPAVGLLASGTLVDADEYALFLRWKKAKDAGFVDDIASDVDEE